MNKVETRVEAIWNLDESDALTPPQKLRVRSALGSRVAGDGSLRVVSQRHRSQSRNRDAAVERLRSLVAAALRPAKPRRPTAPSGAAKTARIEEKKRRGALKRLRAVESRQDD